MNGYTRADSLEPTVDDLVAIGRLLNKPRLAHIWYTLYVEGNVNKKAAETPHSWNGLSISELKSASEVSQATLYRDMKKLEEVEAIQAKTDTQPFRYSTLFFGVESEKLDEGHRRELTSPAMISLIGEAYVDDAVQQFLESYSANRLYDALQECIQYLDDADEDFAETFPEVDINDLRAISPALERVLLQMNRNPLCEGDYPSILSD